MLESLGVPAGALADRAGNSWGWGNAKSLPLFLSVILAMFLLLAVTPTLSFV